MPGTFVPIVPNSPRNSAGASGLVSHMSMWLGPPRIQSSITLLSDLAAAPLGASAALALSKLPSDSPAVPSTPACTSPRRERRRNSGQVRRRLKESLMVGRREGSGGHQGLFIHRYFRQMQPDLGGFATQQRVLFVDIFGLA